MIKNRNMTLRERLVKIELLLDNHLRSHENVLRWVLAPILVGIVLTVAKLYVLK